MIKNLYMKTLFCLSLVVIVALLLFVGCKTRRQSTAEFDPGPIAIVEGEVEWNESNLPQMEIESRGFTFSITVGERIVGHYDNELKYWVCSEDEPLFETYSGTYGDKRFTVLQIKGKDEYGMVDENGKIVVLPMYITIGGGFKDGLCEVQNKEFKHGLIAEDGTVVLPTEYDDIWNEKIIDGLIKVSKDDLQGYVDMKGQIVIPFKYEILDQGGEGMIWFMQEPARWGCLNYSDEIVVQPEFTHTAEFINGRAKAQKGTAQEYYIYTDGRVEECPL